LYYLDVTKHKRQVEKLTSPYYSE